MIVFIGEPGQSFVDGQRGSRTQIWLFFENHELRSARRLRDRANAVIAANGAAHADFIDAHVVRIADALVQAPGALGQRRFDVPLYARQTVL